MNRLVLIIDGNWLLMSRLSVIYDKVRKDDLKVELQKMMTNSIKKVIKLFPIDNLIFVADGGSWRTALPKPKVVEDIVYKGNRTVDEKIDMNLVFSIYEDYLEKLSSNGINVFREKNVEGDDWIYYWSNYLNSNGSNVIIWSRDQDLYQLINSSSAFTVCYNSKQGIVSDAFGDDDYFTTMFSPNYQNLLLLEDCINKAKKHTVINPNDIVVDKIFRGDSGDNIMPIISKCKNNRIYKVRKKNIPENINVYDDNNVKDIIKNIVDDKFPEYKEKLEDIYEHFKYNRNMVVLNKMFIPDEIINIMASKNLILANIELSSLNQEINNDSLNIDTDIFDEI